MTIQGYSKFVVVVAVVALALAACSRTDKSQAEKPKEAPAVVQETAPPPVVETAPAEAPKVEAPKPAPKPKPVDAAAEAAAKAAKAAAAEKAAAEKAAAQETARQEAEKAEAARVEAEKVAAAKKAEAEKVAAAEKAAAAEAARLEAEKVAAAEAARVEAEKIAAEEKAAAEEAARTEAERIEAAKVEAAKAVAAKAEAEALAAARTKAEAERIAALAVPQPIIKASGGVYNAPTRVSLSVALKEAVIYYTLDGTEPSDTNGRFYTGPFTVNASIIVKARGVVPRGQTSQTASAGFAIGEVFVAPGGGGDGRLGGPMGRIGDAVAKAKALGIGTVKLASGTFEDSIDFVVGGLLVSGGWNADFSARSADRTVIRARIGGKTSRTAPSYALKASGTAVNDKTRFERIEFQGSKATYSVGILVTEGASPQFTDCAASAGPSVYGYGAMVSANAEPTFRYCRLDGGEGATSYGLAVDGARSLVELSLLLAGTGSVGGYGLVATNARLSVSSSVVAGNSANVSYGASFYNSKDAVLKNCTIIGGTGQDVAGIFSSISEPSIEDCVISANGNTRSVGVHANYGASTPARLVGNVFLGCANGLYWTATKRIAYTKLNASGGLAGNDGENPLHGDSVDNAIGSFKLGAAPTYEIPSSAGIRAGAAPITFR